MADVDVVIEIPRGSRNKYEWDPDVGAMRFDRRLLGSMAYPGDYGFVPDTVASDGDPLDALVLLEEPAYPGVRVAVRLIGVQWLTGPKGDEPKLLCVPEAEKAYDDVHDVSDLPDFRVREIEQFFGNYQELDDGSTPRSGGVEGREAALAALAEARRAS